MNLNNKWSLNIDNNKWFASADYLNKTDFDSLKEDMKSFRFYQKCLSGSTYVGSNSKILGVTNSSSILNIYDILQYNSYTHYYDNIGLNPLTYSEAFSGTINEYPLVISNSEELYDFTKKSLPDYNLTLKNLFTPERLINDQKENIFYVDIATTDRIDSLSVNLVGLSIDGIIVKEGHKILVKDQYNLVTIPTTSDPSLFFYGHYDEYEVIGTNTTYKIPNSDNGIYTFQNKSLVRTSDLASYDSIIRNSVCVKMGNTNREKQFHLKRLSNGYFPEYYRGELYPGGPSGESLYFEESHNFVIRQRVDYNNLYELSLKDTLKHATQSILVNYISGSNSSTFSYIIPERRITVGEFGSIINHQENITNVVSSKFKSTINSIAQNSRYYWVCGDNGLLLKIDKIDFFITEINLKFKINNQFFTNIITPLNSISFYNDLVGCVVGDYNQIWVTMDGGNNWTQLSLEDFDGYNYNKISFVHIDKFYIGGDNGIFIEFVYSLGNWIAYKRRISKYVDGLDDEYLLVDDITDLSFFTQSIYEYLAISCRGSSIYLYDISNSLTSTYSFLYLEDTNGGSFGDISSVVYNSGNDKLYFSTFENIYELDPIDGILPFENSNIYSTTFSVFLTQSAINSIRSYEDELLMCGNFSLWIGSDLSSTYSLYDSTYFDRLKPRLLFLDYDIGSKLYWFDDYGQYRLPNKYSIPVGFLQGSGSFSSISFNQNVTTIHDDVLSVTYSYLQSNWISYFKDRQKTFEYYSGLSQEYVVEPSFTFSSSNETGKTFSYSTQSITNRYSDIVKLMPSALPPMQLASLTQSSRFREIPGVSIELPSSTYSLYFYDYLGIWTDVFPVDDISSEVGDVLNIQSDIFNGNFIINKIISTSSLYRSAQSAESQIRLFQLSTINASYSATMSISYGTHSILGTFSINSILYPPPASNQLSNILYDITEQINLNTATSGFSAFYNYSSPNGIINLVAPPGASYNGTTASLYFDYNLGKPLIQVIDPTEFTGGLDSFLQKRDFCYFYTDFNENILNNILNSNITIRNLNKYPQNSSVDSSLYFKDNFNSHYISHGYTCNIIDDIISNTQSFEFTPKYSQWSAYYNLQSTIDVKDVTGVTYSDDILYPLGYNNFGYSPTYNILNYLHFINDIEFVPTKEFYAMPNWVSIPGPDNVGFSTQSSIYIDTGLETNRIYFGYELKYIWDSLLEWTFIDLTMNYTTLSSFTSERLLIVKKYYQNGYYIIEFHDSIRSDYPGSVPGSGNNPFYYNIDTFTIQSRRTLQQISDDLQYINRMQRPKSLILDSYDLDTTIGSTQGSWINYESDINFKIPTDSYSKILLSDHSVIRDLTGILYTDYKYELSMQITKLDKEYNFEVSNVSINGSNYQLDFSEKHLLNNNDSIVVSVVGTQTSYPENMLGYHNITINGDYSVVLPIQSVGLFGPSNLKISYVKKDNFLNYQPIDIFDMGIADKKIKQSVEIPEKNWKVDGSIYNLIDLDLSIYKFRLIDGLDLVTLNSKFPWILEADISNAIIGLDKNSNLIWYTGVWNCGRWFGGTWISGYWIGGDWYYGNWTSKSIVDGLLQVKIDNQLTTDYDSIWFTGRWFDGSWENGTWYDGRWYGGTWSNGTWFDGTWNDGTWNDGRFSSGIWVDGLWKNGYFNSDNGPAFWIDGKFFGGDFENGTWYNGVFDEKNNKKSRFGVKSFNSRNSIWKGGKFLSGEFHSFLNIDDYENPDVSDVHKYSKWYTGIFGGYFYGGLCYNINFKNTKWFGGISEDIQIVNVDTDNNSFGLLGEYDFHINDEIYIVDNQDFNTFSYYGSTNFPKKYKVLSAIYDVDSNITDIIVDINLKKSITTNLLDGLWEVTYVESDCTGSLLQFFGYVDFSTSGDEFSELVDSTMFIYNQNISYSQLNTPTPIIGYLNFDTYYDSTSIDLTSLNPILSSTCTYSISFGDQFLSATLSLTQDLFANPSGYTVNIGISRLSISGTSTNLRAVSIFENSIWNSGLWYNGVFKDGTFNGGLWYNGYFEGTWG